MGELLDRVASEAALLQSWAEIQQRTSGDVVEGGAQIAAFADRAAREISQVSVQLLHGTWSPGLLNQVQIPKSSGGARRLAVPPILDRVIERSVLMVIDPILDGILTPWCFGFRRGLGTNDAVRALVEARDDGFEHVLRVDIADCFDRIVRGRLLKALKTHLEDPELLALIQVLVSRRIPGSKSRSRGLPQGSPLSPLFANVYLDAFDRALLASGYCPIRYADDIAVPLQTASEGEQLLQYVESGLSDLGMEVRQDKTVVASFSEGVSFLGAVVTAGTSARPERLDTPLATTIFVTTEGAVLRSRGHRMRIDREGEEPFTIGFDRVRQVVIFGRAHLTTAFLHQVLKRDIDVTLLSGTGRYFGRVQGQMSANPFLRAAQYSLAVQPERQIELAQRVVRGKITNQRALLLRRQRSHGIALAERIERLGEYRLRVRNAQNLTELSGLEGAASREYFGGFATLMGGGFVFTTRRRRPPPDPVNAMLSFGYTLLVQEVIAAVEVAGLDPFEGVLHRRRIGRPSLALDLVEEFRPLIVDALVLRLIGLRIVTPEDFEYPDSTELLCRLSGEARHRYLAEYERRMLTMMTHAGTGRRVSYRIAMVLQAQSLAGELLGRRVRYEPLVWK